MTDDVCQAANRFLSNFTEVSIDEISALSLEDYVEFAHGHLWFNADDAFERGEYFDDNNYRVSEDRIEKVVTDYFYALTKRLEPSETDYDYADGYYYHEQTEACENGGFALMTSMTPLEEDQYFVSLLVFGAGQDWDETAFSLTLDEAWEQYGAPCGTRHAVVYAKDPADRSTYKLVSYS